MGIVIIVINRLNNTSVIDAVYILASYTYGPILGLFAFGIFTKKRVYDKYIPLVALLSPLLCLILQKNSEKWFNGYVFSYELLIFNALFTCIGLWLLQKKRKNRMKKKITCFIPFAGQPVEETVARLRQSPLVDKIYLLETLSTPREVEGCEKIPVDSLTSTATIQTLAARSDTQSTLLYTRYTSLVPGFFALERMYDVLQDTGAGMVYADHYRQKGEERVATPLIAYQPGSLRDDFNFGSLLLYNTRFLRQAATRLEDEYRFAALYALRLNLSQEAPLVHINEYLYTEVEEDNRRAEEKMFDYVDPKNRAVQIEMEQACTCHLKAIGAYLEPPFKEIDPEQGNFAQEVSVIIPVRNRARTIEDAIRSVLSQQTDFPFNLIIVDNHSTDGTTEIIRQYSEDARPLYLIPDRNDLGIGGCWNTALFHPACGRFAVQLDSDTGIKTKPPCRKYATPSTKSGAPWW